MRPSTRRIPLALACAILGPLLGLGAATGDEPSADERRYARDQLLSEARAVEAAEGEDASLDPLRDALAGDREALRARRANGRPVAPEERAQMDELDRLVAVRERLLGRPATDPTAGGKPTGGALAQARWLLRWLRGDEPCSVVVKRRGAPAGAAYDYPLPKDAVPATPDAPPSKPAPAPIPAPVAAPAPSTGAASTTATAPAPAAPVPPTAAPDADPWAPWVAWVLSKEGSLAGKTIESGPCGVLSDLQAVARADATDGRGTVAAAEVDDPYDLSEPLLRLRARQTKERVDAYTKEAPTRGLVDESTVREKTKRATERADEVRALEARRATLLAGLDELVDRVADARREASDLAGQIEEAKRTGADAAPAGTETSLRVRVLEAREATTTLRSRLLYLSALRADARSRLLDESLRLAQNEARAADLARGRFAEELDQVRRERQVERLEYERGRLRSGVEAAEREAAAARERNAPAADVRVEDAFVAATRAVLAAHDVAREAVRAVRAAGQRADATRGARPAAPAPPAGTATDELLLYRDPDPGDLDSVYVKGAIERLPVFTREMVARNHAAATRRATALEAAQVPAATARGLEERFRLAAADAKAKIDAYAAVAPRWAAWRSDQLRRTLDTARADLEESIASVASARARTDETLASLARFQEALLDQGERSLTVRIDPEVRSDALSRGGRSLSDGLEAVLRWLSFQGEAHAGTFAVRHAGPLVALLVLAAALLLGVASVRRRLSVRIDRLALRVPGIRLEGANVEEERRDEKTREAHAEAAVEAKAEELIRQAAGVPAPEGPPPEDAPATIDGAAPPASGPTAGAPS